MKEIIINDNNIVAFDKKLSLKELDGILKFGCKAGKCGICRIRVLQGNDNISHKNDLEKMVFMHLKIEDDTIRLACQCTIYGNVKIEQIRKNNHRR